MTTEDPLAGNISPKPMDIGQNEYFKREKEDSGAYVVKAISTFIIIIVLVAMAFGGYFLYEVSKDKFKTEMNQTITAVTQTNITTSNAYSFTPQTTNIIYNNVTLIIQMPNNLTLRNGTWSY